MSTALGALRSPLNQQPGVTFLKNLEELLRWFPSGTAEGEREILDKVFVYVQEFQKIMSPPMGSPYLLVGKKGSGKSAVLDFAMKFLSHQVTPAIFLRPSDIDTSSLAETDSVGDVIRKLTPVILAAIACRFAETSEGFFTGELATMYDESVRTGSISPGLVGRIGRALSAAAKPLIKIDFNAAFPVLSNVTTKELEKSISSLLSDNRFYIFVDDSDQIANPEKAGHLNRVWGLILAIRALSERVPQIKAIITLRTEIWERLKTETGGQRDQTDHFTNLTVTLTSDATQIRRIIERRLTFAETSCHSTRGIYQTFFAEEQARAPDSEERRSWVDLIVVRSRQRPRDAIQLISKLADHAINRHGDRIDEGDFRSVMPSFSEDRAVLFGQEVAAECPAALEVLRTFSDAEYTQGGFRLTSEQTKSHLARVPSKFGVTLYGKTMNPGSESDIFDLWRFLYISGVLNARVSDAAEREGYRHVVPESDLTLVSRPRWNEMQGMLWEINPAYRDFLVSRQKERERVTGLPNRKPKLRSRERK